MRIFISKKGEYLKGLDKKIKAVEKRAVISELGTAAFVASADMLLKLGIATVTLTGASLLVKGSLDVLTFFMFLLVVSRIYDPFQSALQNLAAVISVRANIGRMNEILSHPVQKGSPRLTNKGTDIVFDRAKFSYDSGGKTTVSRLAARFWDIDSGSITASAVWTYPKQSRKRLCRSIPLCFRM